MKPKPKSLSAQQQISNVRSNKRLGNEPAGQKVDNNRKEDTHAQYLLCGFTSSWLFFCLLSPLRALQGRLDLFYNSFSYSVQGWIGKSQVTENDLVFWGLPRKIQEMVWVPIADIFSPKEGYSNGNVIFEVDE